MPYLGEAAALATAVCWSFTSIFFAYSGRRLGALNVSQTRLLFAFFMLLVMHFLIEGSWFPTGTEPFRWGWFTVSSFFGLVIGDSLLFYAFAAIGPRLSMLIMALGPLINTIAGWVLFRETVTGVEMLGIILTVAGITWVVTEPQGGDQSAESRRVYIIGLLFALGGTLGQSANLLTAKYGLIGDYSPLSATVIRILFAAIVLWALAAVRGQIPSMVRSWRDRRGFAALLAGTVVGPVLGIWFSLIAVQSARIGIASTLIALPPVFLIPLEASLSASRFRCVA